MLPIKIEYLMKCKQRDRGCDSTMAGLTIRCAVDQLHEDLLISPVGDHYELTETGNVIVNLLCRAAKEDGQLQAINTVIEAPPNETLEKKYRELIAEHVDALKLVKNLTKANSDLIGEQCGAQMERLRSEAIRIDCKPTKPKI